MHHTKSLFFPFLIGLLAAAPQAPAYAAVKLSQEWSAPTKTYDCSGKVAAFVLPQGFSIQLGDLSTSPEGPDDLPELYGRAACKAAYSAWALTGYKDDWLPGMRFVLVDSVADSNYQAFHAGTLDHMVVATRGIVAGQGRSRFGELPLVWTLGHELGHGVRADEAYKYSIAGLGGAMAVAGMWVGTIGGAVGAGSILAVTGLAVATCGRGLYERNAEAVADRFGYRVLSRTGIGDVRAKEVVLATLKATQDKPGNPCLPGTTTVHPSIKDRMQNIRDIPGTFGD